MEGEEQIFHSCSPSPSRYLGNSDSDEYYSEEGNENDCQIFSSDDDSSFERVSNSEDEEDEIFVCETKQFIVKKTLPFWYANEDSEHIEAIFKKFTKVLIQKEEFKRSHQPFVGSITRCNVTCGDIFQTFDEVEICNNQRLSPESKMPVIRTVFLLSSWDEDGIPIALCKLEGERINPWYSKVLDEEKSYLYCLPDWHNQGEVSTTKFVYSTSQSYRPVTYANLPWDRAPFSPCIFRKNSNPSFNGKGDNHTLYD